MWRVAWMLVLPWAMLALACGRTDLYLAHSSEADTPAVAAGTEGEGPIDPRDAAASPQDSGVEGGSFAEAECSETGSRISFEINLSSGETFSCASNQDDFLLTGHVIGTGRRFIELESCLDCEDCVTFTARIDVESDSLPDLTTVIPLDAMVEVEGERTRGGTCGLTLLIRNTYEWCYAANPISAGRDPYLAIADGSFEIQHAPFEVVPLPVGCDRGEMPYCDAPYPSDRYRLQFTKAPQDQFVVLGMGESALLEDPWDRMRVFNVRSYRSGDCTSDDWAFWATAEPE
jgi:hypothetical protein